MIVKLRLLKKNNYKVKLGLSMKILLLLLIIFEILNIIFKKNSYLINNYYEI